MRLILWFQAGVGIFLFYSFVFHPSEANQNLILGLSPIRFSVAFLFLIMVVINIALIYIVSLGSTNIKRNIGQWIESLIERRTNLVLWSVYSTVLIGSALCLFVFTDAASSIGFAKLISSRLLPLIVWITVGSGFSIILLKIFHPKILSKNSTTSFLDRFLLGAAVFLVTFFLYEQIAAWIGWTDKSRYSYWDELAEQFLKGRLYLDHPVQTHDLTLYNGKWYVPNPPIPALVMLPLALIFNPGEIDTGLFSIIFSALNTLIVFQVLGQLSSRKWIEYSLMGGLCLTALFAFGTPHLWVGINGRMWFVSQILTVTFLGFGILSALKGWSPWLVGLCVGLAVGTRPNGIMSWPFIFAIATQIEFERDGVIAVRRSFGWSIKSLIPIGIVIAGLLAYNFARFGNYLDFGYTTINGDPVIVESAQTYGLLSTHFILYNLKVMFLYLPRIRLGETWPLLPSGAGMSLFLTTPALIYLFRRYERKIWIFGAFGAIIFNIVFLALYHNAGKDQFGYRYILDFLVPIICLLAITLAKKVPWHFVALLFLSIGINLYGAYWFMNY
jgi:hypothetical protein